MRAWLALHRAAAADALWRLACAPLGALLNALAIGTALSLPLGLYLALDQLAGMARQVSRDPQVSVFLALNAASEDVRRVEARLRERAEVTAVEHITRERALAELERTAGLGDVRATLGHNPLPEALVATVRASAPAAVEALSREVAAWPKVEHVQGDAQWARRLQALLALGRSVVLLLALVLGVSMVAITFNTIRLQILARKEEIEVSKLIGATDSFVRRPFVYLGLLQGLLGGVLAVAVVAAALLVLSREAAALMALYGAAVTLSGPDLRQVPAVLAAAGLLGALGAQLAVYKYLKELRPNTR